MIRRVLNFIMIAFIFIGCNSNDKSEWSNKEELKNQNKEEKSNKAIPVKNWEEIENIETPFMLNLLDMKSENQEWYSYEAETYCKSYKIPFISPEYENYPNNLADTKISFKGITDNYHKINISEIAEKYNNGIIFWKPDSVPVFIPYDSTADGFNSSIAESYYRFTFKTDSFINNLYKKNINYALAYDKEMKKITDKYDFDAIRRRLHKKNVRYEDETGLSNTQIATLYFSFIYFIDKKRYDLIAHNLIAYPIKHHREGTTVVINTPEELLKEKDKIFTKEYLDDFRKSKYYQLYPYQGILMVGKKGMWFGNKRGKAKIVKLNN